MEELRLSKEAIAEARVRFKDNASILAEVNKAEQRNMADDAIALTKMQAIAEAEKLEADFKVKTEKFLKTLVIPPSVHNFLVRNAEVDVPEIPERLIETRVVGDDGKVTTAMRPATIKQKQNLMSINHACQIGRGSTTTTTTKTGKKRGGTLSKRNGNILVTIGNFTTKKQACIHEGIGDEIGVGSPSIPLARHGYIWDEYDGTDFIS